MTNRSPAPRWPPQIAVTAGYCLAALVAFAVGAWWNAFAAFLLVPVVLGIGVVHFFRSESRRSAPARWPRLAAGNGLILGFLLGLAFLGLETYYRFLSDDTDQAEDTLICYKWSQRYCRRNNIGVRDNIDYAFARTPGKRRVTFVGDSFTVGMGVKNVEDRFVNLIRRRHPEWEVHVVAQPGLETSNEVEAVHNLVVSNHYQLDLVVLVYNMNDIGEVMPRWIAEYKNLLTDPFRKSWLCRNSYFVNLYYLRWQMRRSDFLKHHLEEVRDAYQGPIFQLHKIALTAMCNMTVIRGGRLAVVTFPFLDVPLELKSAHERMDGFWREHGVPNLDLLPVFSNLPPASLIVNRHDAHPNEHAHALAAQAIEPFLKAQLENLQSPK